MLDVWFDAIRSNSFMGILPPVLEPSGTALFDGKSTSFFCENGGHENGSKDEHRRTVTHQGY